MNKNFFKGYDEAVSYILEIPRFSAKNDTNITKEFLSLIGEPKEAVVIHVAGTNGKGSVCAFLNSIYIKKGEKTGLFTSPHLTDIRERIRVNNEMISKEEFLEVAEYIMEKITLMQEKYNEYHPSFFEFLFFMAVRYFTVKKTEVIIYETGLGGRLDATNSIMRKSVSVITEIGFDHMEYLGNDIASIAGEKAGIIMRNVPVVFWDGNEISSSVIKETAKKLGCKAYGVNEKNAADISVHKKNIDFSYKNRYDKSVMFRVRTYALYQVYNAVLALKTLQVLHGEDYIFTDDVKEGIADMKWPGRMDEIAEGIITDGGHNEDGIEAFVASVRQDGCIGKRRLIFSAVNDKQIKKICEILVKSDAFDNIALCELTSGRAMSIKELKKIFEDTLTENNSRIRLTVYEHVGEAFEGEKALLEKNDILYIAGSLYLVGEIREYTGAE